jgi:hypothetical protein
MTYEVTIKETLSRTVPIEAEDAAEAQAKVQQMYEDQEIILDSEDFDGMPLIHVEGTSDWTDMFSGFVVQID